MEPTMKKTRILMQVFLKYCNVRFSSYLKFPFHHWQDRTVKLF
jgi:hypothetical protein